MKLDVMSEFFENGLLNNCNNINNNNFFFLLNVHYI